MKRTVRSRSLAELDPNSRDAKAYALVPPGSRVLELGCGDGALAAHLAARGDRVWGVDASAAAVARAAAACVATRVAALEEVPLGKLFPGARFDAVVLADALEHVREPWELLQAARALVDEGGVVVASIPNFAHAAVRLAVLSGSRPSRALGIFDDKHVRFFTRSGVASLFEESGLRVQAIERTTLAFGAPSDLVPDIGLLRVPPAVEQHVRDDADHETLQFVVRAEAVPGKWDVAALRGRLHDVDAKAEEQAIGLRNLARELAAAAAAAEQHAEAARAAEARADARAHEAAAAAEARVHDAAAAAKSRERELALRAGELEARLATEAAARDEALAAAAHLRGERDAAVGAQRAAEDDTALLRAALADAQEQRDEARAAVSDGLNRVRLLEEEMRRDAAAYRKAIEESQTALAELREQTRAGQAAAAREAEAARATESALTNALARAKDALIAAIEKRHEHAEEARAAKRLAKRHELAAAEALAALRAQAGAQAAALRARVGAQAAELRAQADAQAAELRAQADAQAARADAFAAELRAANARQEALRTRMRREALVRLAGEHAAAPAAADGAQLWRDGAASG